MKTKIWNDFQQVAKLVVNVANQQSFDIYCGRPGPWGNPFVIDDNTTRRKAVENHQRWLNQLIKEGDVTPTDLTSLTSPTEDNDLKLGCYCSPLMCHCHTLARYSLAAWAGANDLAEVMKQSTANWYYENAHRAGRRPVGEDGYETPFTGVTHTEQNDVPKQMELDIGPKPKSNIPVRVGKTDVETTKVRSILTAQKGKISFISGYDFSINPYQGCSAACDYCYAAGYTGDEELSKSWGSWVKAKENAPQAIAREAHLLDGAKIYMATVTDPYQPVERQAQITGGILDVMSNHSPKLVIQTRFPLVLRDIARFQAIEDAGGQVQVNVTVTTDDDEIRQIMEPKCPSIPARIRALRDLSQAGITACATITPMLPVQDPPSFAARLLETGIQKVIIQDFHQSEGSGEQFRRSTRPAALKWLETNWGTQWRAEYGQQYQKVLKALEDAFPGQVGQGQKGFAPPF